MSSTISEKKLPRNGRQKFNTIDRGLHLRRCQNECVPRVGGKNLIIVFKNVGGTYAGF